MYEEEKRGRVTHSAVSSVRAALPAAVVMHGALPNPLSAAASQAFSRRVNTGTSMHVRLCGMV